MGGRKEETGGRRQKIEGRREETGARGLIALSVSGRLGVASALWVEITLTVCAPNPDRVTLG